MQKKSELTQSLVQGAYTVKYHKFITISNLTSGDRFGSFQNSLNGY